MFAAADSFFALMCAALTAGAMFGLWLALHDQRLPAPFYVAQQQQLIRRHRHTRMRGRPGRGGEEPAGGRAWLDRTRPPGREPVECLTPP